MRLSTWARRLWANKKGNVLILTAAAMPLLVGSAGLALDTIQLSIMKRHLQRAADSGALAGAYAKAQDKSNTVVEAAVDQALDLNEAFPLVDDPVIEHPTTGTHAGRSVRVEIAAVRSLPFLAFFTGSSPTITVDATAALVFTGQYCMISLADDAGTGITFGGNATVNLGCGVISNTSGTSAVLVNGTASAVTASPIAAVGGVPASSVYQGETLLLPYSLPQRDPFADLPNPTPPTPCEAKITSQTGYKGANKCYKGIDVNGPLNLGPGTYYIVGDLTLNANANVVGEEVTFIFTDDPSVAGTDYPDITIDGNADLTLTAPTSGTYEGVVMYYDRRAPLDTHTINGNSDSVLEGAFYFPSQDVIFNGNSDMIANCIQLVALHLTFEGHTEINNSCPTGGGARSFDASWVRLVA